VVRPFSFGFGFGVFLSSFSPLFYRLMGVLPLVLSPGVSILIAGEHVLVFFLSLVSPI